MATASLAVPKSVMKTIVGRALEESWAAEADSFGVGGWEQAAARKKIASVAMAERRTGGIIFPRVIVFQGRRPAALFKSSSAGDKIRSRRAGERKIQIRKPASIA